MRYQKLIIPLSAVTAVALLLMSGCKAKREYMMPYQMTPIGTLSDPVWRAHEENAEASDFVVHEHEFIGNSARLNPQGEDHVKQIAARLPNVPFPVLVEPSSMSIRKGDKYGFPVHGDDHLDMQRRDVIVGALETMGVADAEQRVMVSPALTPGFQQFEGERAYRQAFSGRSGGNQGGFGGGGGGGGGGTGF